MKLKSFVLTLLTVSVATVAVNQAAQAASLSVLADGLDNPRNMAFGPDGSLYVTTSGRGETETTADVSHHLAPNIFLYVLVLTVPSSKLLRTVQKQTYFQLLRP